MASLPELATEVSWNASGAQGSFGGDIAPGVLAYRDDEVVGWAAVAPRAELPFARSRRFP